uniref:Uncharacterized protein n=1 Tax=Medinilla magnifica TaxID=1799599 RepID=A0A7D9MX56_9MYRT|nr:hypothetical protein [Medinilla magnifica]
MRGRSCFRKKPSPKQVLHIPASFNLLLGSPWIHAIEAVPSTLHQKVKFIQWNHVISIFGDPEEPVMDPIPVIEFQHDENLELAEPVKEYLPLPLVTMSLSGKCSDQCTCNRNTTKHLLHDAKNSELSTSPLPIPHEPDYQVLLSEGTPHKEILVFQPHRHRFPIPT